jgi:esterase/lipase superfamily enzyme
MQASARRLAGLRLPVLLILGLFACRTSDVVMPRGRMGTVYDTAYETTFQDQNAPALLASWKEDAPLYDEPVAIVGWEDGVSTWNVFFATNRDVTLIPDGRAAIGSRCLAQPSYGRVQVTLPKRRRGEDAAVTPPKPLPAWLGGPKEPPTVDPATLARVDAVTGTPWETFLAGVNDQVARSRQQDVLIFVHGFNVKFDDAVARAAQIALDMPFNGAVLAYSWPSQGGVHYYGVDEDLNAASVAPFREFLTQLRAGLPSDARIHILVHSMGNRIVLKALGEDWPSNVSSQPIDQLLLLAPDVGVSDFRRLAPQVAERCRRITLYASLHDAALIASKSLHDEQRAGDAHPPVIVPGVETVDCSAIDITSFLGHGYYSANVDVLADLFEVIKRDRSAEERAHLKSKSTKDGVYWRWEFNAPHDLWTWHFDDLTARE